MALTTGNKMEAATSKHPQTAENAGVIAAKLASPASVSIATLFGLPVNELLLWAMLF